MKAKVITITFLRDGHEVARATGRFARLPGSGSVRWTGNIASHVSGPYMGIERMTRHEAAQFVDALSAMAERNGMTVEITERGTWIESLE